MNTIDLIIEKFGGLTAMAKCMSHKHPTTVQGWRDSGKIPNWRLREIEIAADKNKITLPTEFFKLYPKEPA